MAVIGGTPSPLHSRQITRNRRCRQAHVSRPALQSRLNNVDQGALLDGLTAHVRANHAPVEAQRTKADGLCEIQSTTKKRPDVGEVPPCSSERSTGPLHFS
jgi:hypothetical protein